MITLQKSGHIYRYFDRYNMWAPSDLCSLFWKLLGSMTLFIGIGVLCGVYLIGWFTMFALYVHWTSMFTFLATVLAIAAGCIFGGHLMERHSTGKLRTLIHDVYDGIKEKYCPLVSYKDD